MIQASNVVEVEMPPNLTLIDYSKHVSDCIYMALWTHNTCIQ